MADVLTSILGTTQINLDIHGFDPNGAAGNLDAGAALQHRRRPLHPDRQRTRVGRLLHYRFSGLAGVALGTNVANYDLKHAFQAAP